MAFHEVDLREKVKAAGARWDPMTKLGRLPRKKALAMKLKERIVEMPPG